MNSKAEKRTYLIPEIHQVDLDKEISLILVSGNPGNPGGSNNINPENQHAVPEFFNQHPIMDAMG